MKIKLLVNSGILIASISLLLLVSCNTIKSYEKDDTAKNEQTNTLELKKGELFLVAIADQKEGKEKLLQEYFGTIMPSAMQNGFTPLGQLQIDHVVKANNYTPNNFIGLFKWPSMASIQSFMSEFSPEQLKNLRTPIWNEFKAHMIAIQEDVNLEIAEDKLYEVKVLWAKDLIKTKSISQNGGRVILNQSIVGYEDLQGNNAPNQIMIIEWDNKKSAELNKMKNIKEEVFYTHFTLFP